MIMMIINLKSTIMIMMITYQWIIIVIHVLIMMIMMITYQWIIIVIHLLIIMIMTVIINLLNIMIMHFEIPFLTADLV